MRRGLLLLLFLVSFPVLAAPELSDAERELHADRTTDRDDVLDTQPGFYVLLKNASTWPGDDFSGDAGAAVAPPPDYGFLKDKPEKARGNVYLVEGWFIGADRWPTLANHESEKLHTTLDPKLGEQVTRWTIVTEKDNESATVLVLFHDPNAKMATPEAGSKVRIAARFHKLWTIPSAGGRPFDYPTFVGGATQTVADTSGSSASGKSDSPITLVLAGVLVLAGFFVGMRYLMRRLGSGTGGGTMLQDRIDEMRREREANEQDEPEEEEDVDDLPKDPVAALDVLRDRHEEKP
ncbi:MAG: hypothetical protein AAF085_01215 [Planctomycetota bacterium]